MHAKQWSICSVFLPALTVSINASFAAGQAGQSPQTPEFRQAIRETGFTGTVWWMPSWVLVQATGGVATTSFEPLRDYILVGVSVGAIQPEGTVWVQSAEIRSSVVLRNSSGNEYTPLKSFPPEIQTFLSDLKAGFIRRFDEMGKAGFSRRFAEVGKNLELLLFAAHDADGRPLLDLQQPGTLAIVLKEIAGPGESIYQWRLPVFQPSKPPKKIKDVNPRYPTEARRARVQGIVILEAIIDIKGKVTNVRVLRSIPALDEAAIEAVKQWEYEPTLLEGQPVPIVMTVTVNFAFR